MSLASALLDLPRPAKRAVALGIDALLCVFTVWLAFALRLDEWGLMRQWRFDVAAAASVLIALPLFVVSGFYRAIFRYAGLAALTAIARTLAVYALLYGLIFTALGVSGVPRTVGLLQPMLLLLLVGTSRLVGRYWLGGLYLRRIGLDAPKRALIYGAGSAGRQLAGALQASREMRAVGFIDDDTSLQGSTINGLPVLAPAAIEDRLARLGVTDVLLAMPGISRSRRNQILEQLKPLPLHIRTLPHLDDLAHGRVKASDLRELEIEDLLGRDPVAPDEALMGQDITDRVVLVTGAGGSIGSELCRQILRRRC
jgi:FlaA1/EpsC-like NDP-sugar epimerase